TRQIFVGRVVITLNEKQLTTSDAIKGKNKKDAKTQAHKALLEAYVNQELVSPSEVPNSSDQVTEIIPEEPEVTELKHELPISTLNNLCQKRKWQKPKLNYQQENEIFICTATLQTEENTITKVGKATKKKTAQNLAFDLILVELEAVESSPIS
nr:double-stranded RNA binding motif domain-containing protein [Xenococcaceae cyanobacterium MO_188.B19]